MNKDIMKRIQELKGEVSGLLADFTNGMTKEDVIATGYLFGLLDDIILGNIESDDEFPIEDVILSRMYEVYAMMSSTKTACMQPLRKMINTITEVL